MEYRPQLTGLRGVASSWVAGYHAYASVGGPVLVAAGAGLGFQIGGWIGVEMFFILSIVLLLRSLDSNPDLKHYFKRRIVRIWPMYFATCGATFLLVDPSWIHLALNMAFVGIYIPGGQFVTGAGWSPHYILWTLQIEEAAYLFFPLIHRLGKAIQTRLAWALIAASVAYIVLGHEWGHIQPGPQPWVFVDSYSLPFLWLSAYGTGLLVYTGEFPTLLRSRGATGLLALGPMFLPSVPWLLWTLVLLPFMGAMVLNPPKFLGKLALVVVGEFSYGLYLVHALGILLLGAILGLVVGFVAAVGMESAVRYREIARRFRFVRTA
ncbi:MAG: acyltransferase [Euryarchaeota archaeon]|nr:acyltransferase [Euryarchaeota archaeon]